MARRGVEDQLQVGDSLMLQLLQCLTEMEKQQNLLIMEMGLEKAARHSAELRLAGLVEQPASVVTQFGAETDCKEPSSVALMAFKPYSIQMAASHRPLACYGHVPEAELCPELPIPQSPSIYLISRPAHMRTRTSRGSSPATRSCSSSPRSNAEKIFSGPRSKSAGCEPSMSLRNLSCARKIEPGIIFRSRSSSKSSENSMRSESRSFSGSESHATGPMQHMQKISRSFSVSSVTEMQTPSDNGSIYPRSSRNSSICSRSRSRSRYNLVEYFMVGDPKVPIDANMDYESRTSEEVGEAGALTEIPFSFLHKIRDPS